MQAHHSARLCQKRHGVGLHLVPSGGGAEQSKQAEQASGTQPEMVDVSYSPMYSIGRRGLGGGFGAGVRMLIFCTRQLVTCRLVRPAALHLHIQPPLSVRAAHCGDDVLDQLVRH